MPVSAAEKLQLNEGAIVESRITKIAEGTKWRERAIVPVSDAKLGDFFFSNKDRLEVLGQAS